MKILIIGGAGFVGVNLVHKCLTDPKNQVTVLDSLEPQLRATTTNLSSVWSKFRFIRGGLLDPLILAQCVQDQDLIVNCAAQTSHPLSMQQPVYDATINCLGNLHLLEAVRLLNPNCRLVYVSSSTVVGKSEDRAIDEFSREQPLDIYSANKGVAEHYYRIYERVHQLKTVVLRFANLFGPYGKPYPEFGFINYFIQTAWAGKEVTVWGDGQQKRNLLYAEDAADALLFVANQSALWGETLFVVSEEHQSVLHIAKEIVRVLGRGRLLHHDWPDDRKKIDVDSVEISGAKLRGLTGWQPRYNLTTGLERTREILLKEKQ